MKNRSLAVLSAAALAAAAAVSAADASGRPVVLRGANPVEINCVLATVNDVPVTLGDVLFESWEAESRVYALAAAEDIGPMIADIRRRTLDELVDRRLLVMEFDRLGQPVERRYVEDALEHISRRLGCRSRAELEERAAFFHTGMAELRKMAEERIKIEMLLNGLVYKRADPTPREIADYISGHREEYEVPERVRLSMIKLDCDMPELEETAEKIRAALAADPAPENFEFLAGNYSAWHRESGGDVGLIERSRLRPEFAAALGDELSPGMISPRIDIEDEGVYFLLVREVVEAEEPDWSLVRRQAGEKLRAAGRDEAVEKYLSGLRNSAVIEYNAGAVERRDR